MRIWHDCVLGSRISSGAPFPHRARKGGMPATRLSISYGGISAAEGVVLLGGSIGGSFRDEQSRRLSIQAWDSEIILVKGMLSCKCWGARELP